MALIQYSFRSEVLKENTEIYVILPTYEVFRDPEKKGAETYYKEYERKKYDTNKKFNHNTAIVSHFDQQDTVSKSKGQIGTYTSEDSIGEKKLVMKCLIE